MDILMPTTVVGSLPQPNWLVNREVMLTRHPPRVRLNAACPTCCSKQGTSTQTRFNVISA